MKVWTYEEALNKLITDNDLQEIFEDSEAFVSPDEVAGYFNEALNEAEAEIQATNQDYLLTKYFVPMVQGTQTYLLPDNIYANKIRGIFYRSGSINYPVDQFRRRNKFENMDMTDAYGTAADYMYSLINDVPGQAKMQLHPPSRDTAVLPPSANPVTPMTMWYIRNCSRVPLIGEYCNPCVVASASVDAAANTITTSNGNPDVIGIVSQGVVGGFPGSIAYITGDAVKVAPLPGGTMPGGLTKNATYYAIQMGSGVIKLATTKALAIAGTAIDITSAGTVGLVIKVAATLAIVNATILDIPEFTYFLIQWVKCRIMGKEGDPRFEAESKILLSLKAQMIDTLTNAIQDDDDTIEPDFSAYNELS